MAQAQRVQFEQRRSAIVQDCRRRWEGLLSGRAGWRLRLQISLECFELATEGFVFQFKLFDSLRGRARWIFMGQVQSENG